MTGILTWASATVIILVFLLFEGHSEGHRDRNEYTLLDTGEDLFISKYELSLPSKERMTEFLRKENEGLVKE